MSRGVTQYCELLRRRSIVSVLGTPKTRIGQGQCLILRTLPHSALPGCKHTVNRAKFLRKPITCVLSRLLPPRGKEINLPSVFRALDMEMDRTIEAIPGGACPYYAQLTVSMSHSTVILRPGNLFKSLFDMFPMGRLTPPGR